MNLLVSATRNVATQSRVIQDEAPLENGGSAHESAHHWVTTGIEAVDVLQVGYMPNTYNFLAVSDSAAAETSVGHFLRAGLDAGERVALVTFGNQGQTLHQLAALGFDFSQAFDNESFIFLYYKPTFSHALGLSTDYGRLFEEMSRLSGASRVAFLDGDALLNVQTPYLLKASVEALAATTGKLGSTVLACHGISPLGTGYGYGLILPSCIELRRESEQGRMYRLSWSKSSRSVNDSVLLRLTDGKGYVSANANVQTA